MFRFFIELLNTSGSLEERILGDTGAVNRDDAIFSGESLLQEGKKATESPR